MHKSVLTGILACTLIFVANGSETRALEIETDKTNESAISLVKIETIDEKNKSPLLAMYEAEISKISVEQKIEEKTPLIHTVEKNESLSTISKQYQTTWDRLFFKNIQISDPNLINVGDAITIPETDEVLEPRLILEPVVVGKTIVQNKSVQKSASKQSTNVSVGLSSSNRYVAGYCTWYVKNRRPDLPNNLGDAITWVSRASAQGMATGSEPWVGAVGQRGNHVVYVESVNNDRTVTISEMNHKGLYVHTVRTLPSDYFMYIY